MKKVYYFLGTIGVIVTIVGIVFVVRNMEHQRDKNYADLPIEWEKSFQREYQVLHDNYSLFAHRTGYYDNSRIGDLTGSNPQFQIIFDSWDALSLHAIIRTDRENMMFQQPPINSMGEVMWYAHGNNWEILKENKFKITQAIKGNNNWFYLRTTRP